MQPESCMASFCTSTEVQAGIAVSSAIRAQSASSVLKPSQPEDMPFQAITSTTRIGEQPRGLLDGREVELAKCLRAQRNLGHGKAREMRRHLGRPREHGRRERLQRSVVRRRQHARRGLSFAQSTPFMASISATFLA